MIATAWGWPPSEMARMGLGELMAWEGRAEAVLKARLPGRPACRSIGAGR